MKTFSLKLYLRGVSEPIFYDIGSNERERWIDGHDVDHHPHVGFAEYRTANHHHLFVSAAHVLVAQILDDAPGQNDDLPDDHDSAWKKRMKADIASGFPEETWRFEFWILGFNRPFEVNDLTEHHFVAISCGLLNFESEGKFFITLTDEDGEEISLRAADIMLADGFDYRNETETT